MSSSIDISEAAAHGPRLIVFHQSAPAFLLQATCFYPVQGGRFSPRSRADVGYFAPAVANALTVCEPTVEGAPWGAHQLSGLSAAELFTAVEALLGPSRPVDEVGRTIVTLAQGENGAGDITSFSLASIAELHRRAAARLELLGQIRADHASQYLDENPEPDGSIGTFVSEQLAISDMELSEMLAESRRRRQDSRGQSGG